MKATLPKSCLWRDSIPVTRELISVRIHRMIDVLQAIILPELTLLTVSIMVLCTIFTMDAEASERITASNAESRVMEATAVTPGVVDSEKTWLAAVRDYINLREYRVSDNAAGLQAPSRRHAFRTYFEPTGIRVVDRVAEGSPQLLALRLEQMGRADFRVPVAPGVVSSDGVRVEIRRGTLLEWYVNSPAGLEQGFTLKKRSKGEGPMIFDLSIDGAEASWDGDSVRLATPTGRLLSYGKLKAVDVAGVSLPVTLSAPSAHSIQIQVDDSNASYPIVIDPLLTAAVGTQFESDQRGTLFGYSATSAGDVNGDGYDDVIIGAWRYDAGEKDEGAAFIFHGSANGIVNTNPATANTMLESNQAGAEMGQNVAGAGDVNGDGYDDVIVGSWMYDAGEADEGAAFIFYGSAEGIANGSPATARTRLESNQAGAEMGVSVGGAGDVNGDGYADVIVGAWHYNDEGAAFIFNGGENGIANGNPSTAQTRLTGGQKDSQMGISLDGAGDINGDGYDDVIVGADHYDAGESAEGSAFLFLGGASGIADANPATANTRFESNQAGAFMGVSVGGAGDVNGDGYADVIIGARYYDAGKTDEGVAFIFHGSSSGISDGSPDTAQTRLKGEQKGAWLGYSVAGAGDVNNDGYADVIVGAGRYDTDATLLGWGHHLYNDGADEGAAFLFLGSASGVADAGPDVAYARFESSNSHDYLGTSVSSAGDVNKDGFDDVIIGSYFYDCGQKNEGAVFLVMGSDLVDQVGAGKSSKLPLRSCESLPLDIPVKKVAAVLFVLLGGVILFFFLRRRGNTADS